MCYDIKRKVKTDDYSLSIADPAGEKYTMNKQEFLKCWGSVTVNTRQGGIELLLTPTPEFDTIEDDEQQQKKNLIYYVRYILPFKSQQTQLIVAISETQIINFSRNEKVIKNLIEGCNYP